MYIANVKLRLECKVFDTEDTEQKKDTTPVCELMVPIRKRDK